MAEQFLMAFDASTGSGRCFLISLDGSRYFSCTRSWSYFQPPGLGPSASEFDSNQFWTLLSHCCRDVMAKAGIKPKQVLAVSSTSQREGIVMLDKKGNELYAGPNRDFRAALEGMQISNRFGDDLYQRTGHYPTGLFAPARLLWFKKNQPERYQKFHTLLSINDWVLYRLCSIAACEPTNASETALYDMAKNEWAKDVISELGLPDVFPQVLLAGTILGGVSKQASIETGLLEGTPMVIGGADTQCGLLGCGLREALQMAAVSGTTTPVQMISETIVLDPQVRTWVCPYVIPGKYVLESNSGTSGSVYQWLRDTVFDSDKLSDQADQIYSLMNLEAEKANPGASGVMAHVGVTIFNAKRVGVPPNIILFGLNPLSNPVQSSKHLLIRAVLEGFAFSVKANADQIIEVAGASPQTMAVCGGLSQSNLYNQIIANTMKLPIQVNSCCEGSSIGACICAGLGAGVFKDYSDGIQALVHTKETIQPVEEISHTYKSIYRRWLKSYLEHAK